MKRTNKLLIISLSSFLSFVLLAVLLKFTDVGDTGVNGKLIGLSTLNFYFRDLIGVNVLLYTVTGWWGITGISVAFIFCIVGSVQWIKRKSILKVDREILLLGGLYLSCIAVYFLFEFVVINYRPVVLHENSKSSFPSSHVFITCTVMLTAIPLFNKYFAHKKVINKGLNLFACLTVFITVVGRTLSGVHWITDILGGVLLTAGMCCIYRFCCLKTESRL